MTRVQNDSQKLVSEYSEEKNRLEKRMQELSEAARQENERRSAEYNQQMQTLRTQLEQTSSALANERADLSRQIEDLRRQRVGGHSGGLFGMIGCALDSVFGF
jgi:uncharacterized coiled-coil DUF342 family protein